MKYLTNMFSKIFIVLIVAVISIFTDIMLKKSFLHVFKGFFDSYSLYNNKEKQA